MKIQHLGKRSAILTEYRKQSLRDKIYYNANCMTLVDGQNTLIRKENVKSQRSRHLGYLSIVFFHLRARNMYAQYTWMSPVCCCKT